MAGAAGWIGGTKMSAAPAAPQEPADTPQQTTVPRQIPQPRVDRPVAALDENGLLSVHAERTSIEALRAELQGLGIQWPSATTASCARTDAPTIDSQFANAIDAATLTSNLQNGSEADRLDALHTAAELALELPANVLRTTFESDPSGAVRLLALTTYLDLHSGDATAIEAALNVAAHDLDPDVQEEARNRRHDFEELQRVMAAISPQ